MTCTIVLVVLGLIGLATVFRMLAARPFTREEIRDYRHGRGPR